MRKYNFVSVSFIVTNFVGTGYYMNWDQIKELRKADMIIGSHGMSHCFLTELNDAELQCELEDSKKLLEEMPADARGCSLFLYIWQNNVQVLAITWLFSFLLFVPFLIEYINGLVISVVIAFSLSSITWGKAALMILPHGIFELLFFLLGALLSLIFWLKIYVPKNYFPELTRWQVIKRIIFGFVIIIIGLGVSAAIEAWLTPLLAGVN